MDVTNSPPLSISIYSPPLPLNVSENTPITETTTQLTATTTINSTAPPIPRARLKVKTSLRPRQETVLTLMQERNSMLKEYVQLKKRKIEIQEEKLVIERKKT